jgi:hypothetical protein
MDNLPTIEESYKKYINNLSNWTPEGILYIDLELLNDLDLLNFFEKRGQAGDELTRYFQVVESSEKITLINDRFIVWIVPENVEGTPTTFTLIALNSPPEPKLEAVLAATGVYNTSALVLRIIEKFLAEIQENEELLGRYKAA